MELSHCCNKHGNTEVHTYTHLGNTVCVITVTRFRSNGAISNMMVNNIDLHPNMLSIVVRNIIAPEKAWKSAEFDTSDLLF